MKSQQYTFEYWIFHQSIYHELKTCFQWHCCSRDLRHQDQPAEMYILYSLDIIVSDLKCLGKNGIMYVI